MDANRETHTFLFADLAGFTALTEAHGDEDAVALVDDFCASVRELLPERGAEEVKAIGDAVMIRVTDPAEAVQLGLQIAHDVGARHGAPVVRVGMHTGPAVERDGDWFGGTVNLASRVAGAAGGGEVLLTSETRSAAGEVNDAELRKRGRHRFKNVAEPVELYAAVGAGENERGELPIDPVCRMAVDPGHEAGVLTHEGSEYHFCSLECVQAFASAPEEVLQRME